MTDYQIQPLRGARHRCAHCRRPVPPGLRCVCEMGAEQEVCDRLLAQAVESSYAAQAALPVVAQGESFLVRDWKAIATIGLLLVIVVMGVQFLRLQKGGEAELRSSSRDEQRMEVSR